MPLASAAEPLDEARPVCGAVVAWKYRDEVLSHARSDKWNHCALSCVMTLRCGPWEAAQLGILKEVLDVFGPGNAEAEDLRADAVGVKAGIRLLHGRVRSNRFQCYDACFALYR